jgi:hypothetical protein
MIKIFNIILSEPAAKNPQCCDVLEMKEKK